MRTHGCPTVLAVGFFDGVHLGHRRILDGADSVLTFSNHPLSVLAPERVPPLLMSAEERLSELAADGREVRAPEFTGAFAAMPPEAFAQFLVREYPRLAKVRCGENWTFGAGGRGNPALLGQLGIEVDVVGYAEHAGEAVSSTRIRTAMSKGDVRSANAMLGRAFSFSGKVRSGKGVGGKIGYPTLNLEPSKPLFLPFGVYAAKTGWGLAAANWGLAPTMAGDAWRRPVFEVHLLEPARLPSVETLKVEILDFVRPERKFADVADLTRQISADVDFVWSLK